MKLDYNILWIDDKISDRPFQSILNEIKTSLEEQFFNCKINQAEDFSEFKSLFNSNIEYDFIITDYSLNEGTTGKQVIDFIRDKKHDFTEIFFYSANRDVKNIELINKNRISFYQLVDGNYRELETEIQEVISQTIKKFQHIITMRGMIMQETSSLDIQMAQIVNGFLNDESNKNSVDEIWPNILESIRSNNTEKKSKVDRGKVKDILKDDVLFNSSQKIFALGQILNFLGKEDFSKDYNKEVILYRNQFAHAELHIKDDGTQFFKVKVGGQDEIIFDAELCKTIRKNILKHKKNLTQTHDLIVKIK